MRTVLVTGGAGYIGSHVCKALAARGYRPVTLDNLSRGHASAVKWGPLEVGGIGDRPFVASVFERWRPEAVFHFAAFAYVGESMVNPAAYYENNVMGSLTLLEAMRRADVRRLVFSSTCATYGEVEQLPITEETPQRPINPYGRTKHMIESAIRDYTEAHAFEHVIFRYFNAAGADPDGEIGESHEPEPHLIPNALAVALDRRSHLDVYGMDYPTPDGTCIRDYVHVSDLAEAHLLGFEKLTRKGGGLIYNLSTGRGVSVRDIVASVERVTGRRIETKAAPRRPGDPPILYASAERATRELEWSPRRSALDMIVADAWSWAQARNPR